MARTTVATRPNRSISTAAETPIPNIAMMMTTLCQRGIALAWYNPMLWIRTPIGNKGSK